jgi:hypothetical protein
MAEIDGRVHVAIRSFRRAGRVTSFAPFPFASVWVPESQGDEYRSHYGGRVITIPDDCDGNLCRKSNAILDRSPCAWTLIVDDDIPRVGMWEGGRRHWLEPDQIAGMIVHQFELADQLGVRLWGINQNFDPTSYRVLCPFNLLAPILGPFNGHLSPELRYDESVLGKDDYDFWLQNIRRYHKTLRANKYHYIHDHGKKSGGFVSMRTAETEQHGVDRLIEKWGSTVIHPGGVKGKRHSTGRNILNTRVSIPINGC